VLGAQASSNDKGCQYRPKQFRLGEGAFTYLVLACWAYLQ